MNATRQDRCMPVGVQATLGEITSRRRRSSVQVNITLATSSYAVSARALLAPLRWDRIAHYSSIIWSFARADIKTMVLPITLFGLCSALGGQQLFRQHITSSEILARTPLVVLWTWLNVVLLSISNQRSPDSISEDRVNKPWRPIPSGRISAEQSRRLLLAVAPVVMVFGAGIGISRETFWAIAGSWYYSDLGGADDSLLLRQVLNGVAYLVYGAGVCRIFAGPQAVLPDVFWTWLFIISTVVATTIQVQDLKDEEGDRLRNRNTAPIILGNMCARASVSIGVLIWSVACPLWWQIYGLGMSGPVVLGCIVAYRALQLRTQNADKKTFLIWAFWMISLFILPAIKGRSG